MYLFKVTENDTINNVFIKYIYIHIVLKVKTLLLSYFILYTIFYYKYFKMFLLIID